MKSLVLVLSILALSAFQTGREEPVKALMKAKAGYAHRLLDAVVLGEVEVIRDQAFRLKAVAQSSDWKVVDTEEYVRETESFTRATERLLRSAAGGSREAAALAYVDLTLSCVHVARTRAPQPPGSEKPAPNTPERATQRGR
jgi:hypothetical protein